MSKTLKDLVVIPLAGKATRMESLSVIPKHMLPYKDKPILSHIIEQFPKKTRFCLIVSDTDTLTRDFISLTYPDYDIEVFESNNPAPGSAAAEVQSWARDYNLSGCSLWVVMGDAVFDLSQLNTYTNSRVLAVARVPFSEQFSYTMLKSNGAKLTVSERKPLKHGYAWTGIAYFKSALSFASVLELFQPTKIDWPDVFKFCYEEQGCELVELPSSAWTDLGTYSKYVRHTSSSPWHPIEQCTYCFEDKVVKLHSSVEDASLQALRSCLTSSVVPVISQGKLSMTNKLTATDSYVTINKERLNELLEFDIPLMWGPLQKGKTEKFYAWFKDKVLNRVSAHLSVDGRDPFAVNGLALKGTTYSRVEEAFKRLQAVQTELCTSSLHGDLTLPNILLRPDGSTSFVDQRAYLPGGCDHPVSYDLSKLWLSLHLDFQSLRDNKFDLTLDDSFSNDQLEAWVSLQTNTKLRVLETFFLDNLASFNVYSKAIQLQGALHLLSMSGYHRGPVAKAMYSYSQHLLQTVLSSYRKDLQP